MDFYYLQVWAIDFEKKTASNTCVKQIWVSHLGASVSDRSPNFVFLTTLFFKVSSPHF